MTIVMGYCSCTNIDKVATEPEEPARTQEAWIADGYSIGVVQEDSNAEEPCEYLIEVKGMGLMEVGEIPKDYKKDGLKVWVKISPQRRQSICTGTTPGDLVEIKKRES